MIDLTNPVELGKYLKEISKDGKQKYRWSGYNDAVDHATELKVHFNGIYPHKLLDASRPNEPAEVKEYRKSVYQAKTKSKAKKIINVLQRIQNGKNFSILFPDEVPTVLKNNTYDESLEAYTMKDYPYYGNLLQWVFDVCLKQMLVDPNSVIAFEPIDMVEDEQGELDDTQFIKPFGKIYNSENVIDFVPDQYYTLLTDEKSPVKVGQAVKNTGLVYKIFTENEIIKCTQIGEQHNYQFNVEVIYQHNLDELPIITLGGEYLNDTYPFQYESFVSGILPFWNEAISMDSDLRANYVGHLFLERVEVQVECDNTKCGKNASIGQVCDADGKTYECQRCKGTGYISGRSPYGVTSVKKENISGESLEFPGVQYIDKPTAIVELAEKKLQSLYDAGYEAINMDILKDVGANQSGVSKTIDRTDLDSFLILVSNNIFDNIVYYSFKYISAYRYAAIQGINYEEQIPTINKPTHFDVVSASKVIEEIGQYPNIPQQLKDVMIIDAINKKFPNDDFQREYNKAIVELDPLRGKTTDDILAGTSSGWISKESATLSQNIATLVMKAYEQNNDFFELTYTEKMDILYKLAKQSVKVTPTVPLVDNSGGVA